MKHALLVFGKSQTKHALNPVDLFQLRYEVFQMLCVVNEKNNPSLKRFALALKKNGADVQIVFFGKNAADIAQDADFIHAGNLDGGFESNEF